MTIKQRAAVKTAMVVGVIAIIFAIATVWPPILGYAGLTVFASMFVGFIYGIFYLIEEGKRSRWK